METLPNLLKFVYFMVNGAYGSQSDDRTSARSILIEWQTGGRPVHNFVDKVDMESADEFVRYFFKCKHVL